MDANGLLLAPRGRELCARLQSCGLGQLADANSADAFLDALAHTVTGAMYWQEPSEPHVLDLELDPVLRPIAEAVLASPGAQWWSSPIARDDQHEVLFDPPSGEPEPTDRPGPHEALETWREDELAYEAFNWPPDPTANSTGHWWSAPVAFGLIRSTRTIDPTGPVGLRLVEDPLGWTTARSRPLELRGSASVFEIAGPEDWIELVRRYPLPVPNSRKQDWWRATGRQLNWAIPDYLAVSKDFDAIHLTVTGYLSIAGRALAIDDDNSTVLAGWDPDQTCWLSDSTTPAGPFIRWRADSTDSWTRISA